MRHRLLVVAIVGVGCGGSPGTSPGHDGAPPLDGALVDGAAISDASRADAEVPDGAPTAPLVIATTPADQAVEVEPTAALTAMFSTDMTPSSVDTTSFAVAQDGAAVAGTVAYDATSRTASFAPGSRLALRGAIAASIVGATDTTGVAASPAHWTFSIRDGAWSGAAQVDALQLDSAPSPHVAIDAAGVATAVWDHLGVWTARYAPGQGWASATRLADGGTPVIAIDPAGDTTVAWLLASADGIEHLWGTRRAAGGAFEAPVRIDTDDAYPHHVGYIDDLGADAAGDVIAIWSQADSIGGYLVRARRFVPGTGWGAVVELGHGINPSLAIAPDGRAVAGWMGAEGNGLSSMWGAAFTPDAGWSPPVELDPGTGLAFYAHVAIDPDGRAMLVWLRQLSTGPTSVWSAAFTPAGGWAAPIELEDGATFAYDTYVAALPDGAFDAVWSRFDSGASVRLRRFAPATGWTAVAILQAGASTPRIVADTRGNAVVVWLRQDATEELYASRGAPDGSWAAPVHVDSATSGDSFFPSLAISPLGTSVAVWTRSDGPEHSGSSYAPFGAGFD